MDFAYLNSRIPFLIATVFFLVALFSSWRDDITFDEPDHLQYGIHILKGHSQRYVDGRDFNTTMPVTALNAIPRAIEQIFNPGLQKNDWGNDDILRGRYLAIAVALVLLIYIFCFAKSIGGPAAGCWAMFLAASDPNILAHGRLVTTDIYYALAFVMTLYHLYQWLVNEKADHFYFWCLAIAFAQCCKINNILLYPVCLVAIIGWRRTLVRKNWWKQVLVFVAAQLLVINIFFLFSQTGFSLAAYNFKSAFFQNLQQGFLSKIPLPLPKPYIDTFDLVQYERESFDGIPMNYLLGELRYKQGFPFYYFVCWVLKTPLLTQVLLIITTIIFLVRAEIRKRFSFFFLVPAALVMLLVSTSAVQSGYRYLLPVLSMALIFCGVLLAQALVNRAIWMRLVFLIWPAITLILSFSNPIAYTNSLVTDKKMAYRYFADSNLSWGQRQKKIQSFLHDHPDYIFEPVTPVKGTIVVELNSLVGLNDPSKFEWLRKNYQPMAVFESCYLIYQIKD